MRERKLRKRATVRAMKPMSVATLFLLLLCGCPAEKEPAAEPKDTAHEIYVSLTRLAATFPEGGLEVTLDGKSIGTVNGDKKFVTVMLPMGTFGVDLASRLKAKLSTTCGPEPYDVKPYYDTKEQEEDFRKNYMTPAQKDTLSFHVGEVPRALVYVDNVGGKARKLGVGKQSFDVPKDASFEQRVITGKCGTARKLTVDGDHAGELSAKELIPNTMPVSLVDAIGGHCYLQTKRLYKERGSRPIKGAVKPETKKLERARSYAIPYPHDFLTASPKTYKKWSGPLELPDEWRLEINRCGGTPKPGGALR